MKTLEEQLPEGSISKVYGVDQQVKEFITFYEIHPSMFEEVIAKIELIVTKAVKNSRQR
jgi:hypothetical protein